MLAVELSGRTGLSRCHDGASSAIYAVYSSLRTAQQSDDLAIYHGGLWHWVASDEAFDRLSIDQPCTVRFQRFDSDSQESLSLGPFPGVVIARGVIKTACSKARLLAIFDDSLEQWRAVDDTVWPVVVIEEATAASSSAA
jgi:hypothetical protein